MTQQESPQVIGVRHVGLSARDPAALAEFYQDVLGLQVVPTDTSALGATAFLSSHPAEGSLDLALFANPALQHTAFEVRSLTDLRAFHQRVLSRGVPITMASTTACHSPSTSSIRRGTWSRSIGPLASPAARATGIPST